MCGITCIITRFLAPEKMQEKGRDQNEKLTSLSFFEKESIFIYDFNTLQILDVNNQALKRYGYSKDELTGMKICDLGERVALSDFNIEDLALSKIYPKELWRHHSKSGDSWIVQLTSQKFRFNSRPVRLVVAHDIDDIV